MTRKKQNTWMRWKKDLDNMALREVYQQLKCPSREVADKAHEVSWANKAEKAKRLHEAALTEGRGGSILKISVYCSWVRSLE